MLALGRAISTQGWVRDFRSVAWSADGAQHFVLITAAAFDWDGEEVAVMTTRDVTETERAKQEGDAILDNAVVGVCLVRNHRLERVNPQLERMLGLAPGSLVGKPTEVLFPSREKFKDFVAVYESPQAAGETIDIERRAQRADGTQLLLRMRGRAVDPRRRQETGTIWVVEDITDRRRAELELADAQRDAEAAQPRQEQLPGHDEPRDPHAAQRRAGPGAAAAGRSRCRPSAARPTWATWSTPRSCSTASSPTCWTCPRSRPATCRSSRSRSTCTPSSGAPSARSRRSARSAGSR